MNNTKYTFEKTQTKFIKKREHFKRIIERWKTQNKTEDYKKASKLFADAERYSRDLQSDFMGTAEGDLDNTVIRERVAKFKTIYKELYEITKSQTRQWCEAIIIALILAAILRNFLFGLYHVPSGSAEPQILIGDRLWGNKLIYFFTKPKVGEFVIFDNPNFPYDNSNKFKYYWQRYVGIPVPLLGLSGGPENIVKRVIAAPGDTIEGKVEDGHPFIYRNGVKIKEPYVNKLPLIHVEKYKGFISAQNIGPLTIPSFLNYSINEQMRFVTYDPSKSYDEQPYYYIKPHEVIRDFATGKPILLEPSIPTHDGRTGICVDIFGPIKLQEGQYWVMGDSRKNSNDSRFWGPLDEKYIHGRASFIIYSIDSGEAFWLFDLIKHPIDFWFKYIRWNKIFKGLGKYNNYRG